MRSFWKFIVALSAALALVGTAVAAGKGEGTKSREKIARAACLMGDYQKGTKILVDLFIETANPVYLFNQGRCYEQNHRWEDAVDRFREFLRTAPAMDAETKAYVDKHLANARVSEKVCKWESRGGLLNPRRPHEHGTQDPIPIL